MTTETALSIHPFTWHAAEIIYDDYTFVVWQNCIHKISNLSVHIKLKLPP